MLNLSEYTCIILLNKTTMSEVELKELWRSVLNEIEVQISRPNFLTWLKNSELVEKDSKDGVVFVSLPNNFAKEWVKNRYHKVILGSLRNIDSSIKNVNYVVGNKQVKISKKKKEPEQDKPSPSLPLVESSVDPKTNLNSKYTFDTFVVGSSNELAHAAAQAVTKEIGKRYNPLFIYGGVGLGKTHLLQAIGNTIKGNHKNEINVLYVTSEKFVNDVVWAVRNRRTDDIKKKYRSIDVLIIDDIQFIGGKPATEMEFFYTFNSLYENSKQIIISSDRAPAAIPTLEERLRSRFEGGMIADISYPDYETRLAILKTKVKQNDWDMSDNVLEQIASKVQKNIRELEGVLNKVLFYEQYKKNRIDPKKLEEIINEVSQVSSRNISPDSIIEAVSEAFDISSSEMIARGRKLKVALPRQIAIYLLRDMLNLSYTHIGEKIGKRDHTTAIHAYEKISNSISQNPTLNQKIILIKDKVYNK